MNKKLADYVTNLCILKFPYYFVNMKRSDILKFLYDNVCRSPELKIYSINEIERGVADKKIIEIMENYFKEEQNILWASCKNLKKNIVNEISNVDLPLFSKDVKDCIVGKIIADLIQYYNYHELNAGGFSDVIITKYEDFKKEICSLFLKNIRRIVNRKIEVFEEVDHGITQKDIDEYVLGQLLRYADFQMIGGIDKGKYDEDIFNLIVDYINKNKQPHINSYAYIANLICEYDKEVSSKDLEYFTKQIDDELIAIGMRSKEIVSEDMKQTILDKYDYKKQRRQSIRERRAREREQDRQDRIKHHTRKRRIIQGVAGLTLLGTLIAAGAGIKWGVEKVGEFIDDELSDSRYKSASSKLGGNQYDYVSTKYSNEFQQNAELVVTNYREYSKLGEEYGYMAFYDAYRHVTQDKLAIMDAMLVEVKGEVSVGTTYYLRFMYDRLVALGCDEVQQSKYLDVVEAYESADLHNTDENKTAYECLNDKQKDLIEDIKNWYNEYSSKCYKELAEIGVNLDNTEGTRRSL